jgi:hypothetical protein
MKDLRELVGDLSQTNHYLVSFSTLNSTLMSYIQNRVGFAEDTRNFLSRKTGLLCSEASLPTSSLATGEVRDNFMGIPQEFAHTRLYTDIDFTFYIDSNYVNLRIFEAWMDYIAGGSQLEINELDENYYRRMNYPDNYKVQTMFISKFERDFNSQIDYQFVNAFPKLVTAIPVSYGAADLLKVTVSFTYDRYIVNPKGSIRKANSSGFSDIPRVANDTAIRDQEIQALMDDGGYSKEDATTIQGGGFVETVFEPEKTPPVERKPEQHAERNFTPSQVTAAIKALGGDPNATIETPTITQTPPPRTSMSALEAVSIIVNPFMSKEEKHRKLSGR